MKVCLDCGHEKPLSEFYKHSGMADGHLNKCKSCVTARVRKHRSENPHVQEYDRSRGNRQPKEYRVQYRQRNSAGYSARTALGNAVRDGKVQRLGACEICGSTRWVHGHHHDYSKPLDVWWLCAQCHRQLHAVMERVRMGT